MNEHGHFTKFKRLHREGMALVDVEKRSFTSNGRGSTQGMQGTLHLPRELPAKQRWHNRIRSWWHRFEREWEPITVNRQIDSITMPKWIASAILVAFLAFAATSWWRLSDQRDMLIELRTEIRIQKEFEAERSKELKSQADLNKVYIDNVTSQLNIIKGLLTAQQLNVVEGSRKGAN